MVFNMAGSKFNWVTSIADAGQLAARQLTIAGGDIAWCVALIACISLPPTLVRSNRRRQRQDSFLKF
jgi:hypothetical protein